MRLLWAMGACAALIAGCQSTDASRQERCQKADWAMVGERDGVMGPNSYADRYQHICGDMFQPQAYKEGFAKGDARRPRPRN